MKIWKRKNRVGGRTDRGMSCLLWPWHFIALNVCLYKYPRLPFTHLPILHTHCDLRWERHEWVNGNLYIFPLTEIVGQVITANCLRKLFTSIRLMPTVLNCRRWWWQCCYKCDFIKIFYEIPISLGIARHFHCYKFFWHCWVAFNGIVKNAINCTCSDLNFINMSKKLLIIF
jgi:hypothetical protein